MTGPHDSEDLTFDDHLVADTEKHAADDPDADLPAPSQDPADIPETVVDDRGEPT